MQLDNAVLRVPGAEFDEKETESDSSDDSAGEETTDGDETTISIRAASLYGTGQVLADSLNIPVEPGSHAPGLDHSILASFLAVLSGSDLGTVIAWANTSTCFVKLEWSFPDCEFPKITTRHILLADGHADVSLSGGLGFAVKLLRYVQSLGMTSPPSVRQPHFPTCHLGLQCPPQAVDVERETEQPHFQNWTDTAGFMVGQCPFPWPGLPGMPFSTSPPPLDDEISIFTDYTSQESIITPTMTTATTATTWLNDASNLLGTAFSGFPETTISPSEPQNAVEIDESAMDHLVQRQIQIETFEQQKRAAEAMYAHNGDTRGLLAVASASQGGHMESGLWQPTGLPYF
ncbi:hypothetical protein B0H66DRAFT_534502 [Apodospora peruviana]|uniref:Uncharacterized protein n=1 Tax=Apodospora peruviana TaxID=516989 RepID=A0AAE0I191_9PEZI|nr:hypothetical protein B0H66DRAFT_534502 [Apodospora peruviana]